MKFNGSGQQMVHIQLDITHITSPLHTVFSISRGAKHAAETIQLRLRMGDAVGRGECVPYPRYGETPRSVMQQIEALRPQLEQGLERSELQDIMPAGAARCAIDCALWDLEAKKSGIPVWKRAGLAAPQPIETAITIVLETPEKMALAAKAARGHLLKLKLGGQEDLNRAEAVHEARPDARMILDANEGLSREDLPALAQKAAQLGVVYIEQPFPANEDSALLHRPGFVAICADESAHISADIPKLAQLYDAVNIKLDKTGGLTEGLKMARAARKAGMGIMIGCMVAGSLSMAPALLLASLADAADLDGPLWLGDDIKNGLTYEGGLVFPPKRDLWG